MASIYKSKFQNMVDSLKNRVQEYQEKGQLEKEIYQKEYQKARVSGLKSKARTEGRASVSGQGSNPFAGVASSVFGSAGPSYSRPRPRAFKPRPKKGRRVPRERESRSRGYGFEGFFD